ncbi:hypothetical protein [Methylobacterium oxalidis]|uniref:hypothetical protein n=1 Tax=Methylobacterium oxalidis TaxID=944322 RepID=UPI003314AE31
MFPYLVLLAGIGGTNTRFAVLTQPVADPTPVWKVATAGFSGPVGAIQAYFVRPDRSGHAPPSSPSHGGSTPA